MSKYDLAALIKMWEQDKLTVEQAVGQMMLHMEALAQRVGSLEKAQEKARQQPEGNARK